MKFLTLLIPFLSSFVQASSQQIDPKIAKLLNDANILVEEYAERDFYKDADTRRMSFTQFFKQSHDPKKLKEESYRSQAWIEYLHEDFASTISFVLDWIFSRSFQCRYDGGNVDDFMELFKSFSPMNLQGEAEGPGNFPAHWIPEYKVLYIYFFRVLSLKYKAFYYLNLGEPDEEIQKAKEEFREAFKETFQASEELLSFADFNPLL